MADNCSASANVRGATLPARYAARRRSSKEAPSTGRGSSREPLQRLLNRFRLAVEIAEREGVMLAVQNEYSCSVGTELKTRLLLNSLSSKWVGSLWDLGNAFFAREKPYPDGYEKIKDAIIHVHVKDARVVGGQFTWLPIGKGNVNYNGQFAELSNNRVTVSLETHYAPSGNREQGTRESFAGIKNIINELF